MRLLSLSISMCLAAIALSTTVAFARPDVVLHLSGATVEKTSSGEEKLVPLVSDQKLKAGEVVRWTIVGTNKGSDPALHFTPSDKIPAGTAYIAGTASTAGGHAEFSLDEGKTWSSKPMVTVQTATGPIQKPADPSTYTNIRWIADKPLAPKGSVRFSFEVRVK
jgi:uncharacterized repeat protein (TIGR01451 family)